MVVILDKNLRKINEPSDEFLQNLKEICLKEFPDLKIEIRE